MSLPRCGHGSEVLVVAVSSVHCLSVQVWVNSFRLWFSLSNLSSLRPRARCFYLLVVFPGSCPLWCSAPQRLLLLIGSLRVCSRPQDNLPPRPQILSRFILCSIDIRFLRGILPAVRNPLESEWRGRNLLNASSGKTGVQLKITTCTLNIKNTEIICTSALMIVLFILMPSRNAIELQTVW